MDNFTRTFVPKQKMWYDDLCEYYNVTKEQALELGTRSNGRKPNLPGSRTCEPVSGMTWEEFWDAKPRDTLEQKMAFYNEVGSWLSFRQSVYRKDFDYGQFYRQLCPTNGHILEYGCGIAPLTDYVAKNYGDDHQYKFSLVELASEAFEFAKWRLKNKAPKTEFKFYEPSHEHPVPDFGDDTFNLVCIMDVLEHLPNPYNVMKEIVKRCAPGAYIVDTWIDHDDDDVGYADLQEAADQRDITIAMVKENFDLVSSPGGTINVWRKK